MKQLKLTAFTQTNLWGVLERAQEILEYADKLGRCIPGTEAIINAMYDSLDVGDDWERAALSLCKVEMLERRIRMEDPSVEKFPKYWAGGIDVTVGANHD